MGRMPKNNWKVTIYFNVMYKEDCINPGRKKVKYSMGFVVMWRASSVPPLHPPPKEWRLKKETTFAFGQFTTISGHFFANYINISHSTEVQTVILRCLTGLNLNWFESYDIKCKYFHFCFIRYTFIPYPLIT